MTSISVHNAAPVSVTSTPVTSPTAKLTATSTSTSTSQSPFIAISPTSSRPPSPHDSDSDTDESAMGAGTSKKNYLPVFLTHAASTQQGRRQYNEDRFDVRHPLVTEKKVKDQSCSMFGVYDGHGGEWTAEFCQKHLHASIMKQPTFRCSSREKAIARGFQECDETVLCEQETSGERSGTTAVVVLVDHDYIYSGNAGDSRAVLCRNGVAIELSQDHKPTDPEEKKRIEAAGGRVPGNYAELHDKGLAVSRAIGNLVFKQNPAKKQTEQIIVCTPHLAKVRRCRQDDFLILASDGLWNIMDNQRACDYVKTRLADGMEIDEICNKLTQFALDRKSQDNVTVVLVVFEYDDDVSQALRRKREDKKEEKKREVEQREADRARQRELVMKEREERWLREKAEEAARALESKTDAVTSDPVIAIDSSVTSTSYSSSPQDSAKTITDKAADTDKDKDTRTNTTTAGSESPAVIQFPTLHTAPGERHPCTPTPTLRASDSASSIPRLKIHSSSSAHDVVEHVHDSDTKHSLRTVSDVSEVEEELTPNTRRGRGTRPESDGRLHSIPDTQRGMNDHHSVMLQVQRGSTTTNTHPNTSNTH